DEYCACHARAGSRKVVPARGLLRGRTRVSRSARPDRRHRRRPLARRGHGAGRGGALKETKAMASSRDKNGRPVVDVTGMGVVTSFGAGKADNWAKLTA